MADLSHSTDHDDADKPDVQNKFGAVVGVWFALCAIVFIVLIVLLVLSLTGQFQSPFMNPPE